MASDSVILLSSVSNEVHKYGIKMNRSPELLLPCDWLSRVILQTPCPRFEKLYTSSDSKVKLLFQAVWLIRLYVAGQHSDDYILAVHEVCKKPP